ncbi:hypothetical protein J7L09_01655 [bacterium]|nr:hypothetical protein [bacterium]
MNDLKSKISYILKEMLEEYPSDPEASAKLVREKTDKIMREVEIEKEKWQAKKTSSDTGLKIDLPSLAKAFKESRAVRDCISRLIVYTRGTGNPENLEKELWQDFLEKLGLKK